jgi:hypothetical protein
MIRCAVFGLLLGIAPALAETPAASDMVRLQNCLSQAAAKFDDRVSDASAVADTISGMCAKEWAEFEKPWTYGFTGSALIELKAKNAQIEHEVSVAAVLAGRANGRKAD